MKLFLTLCFFAFSICASAQNVGIGNATPQVPLSFASTLGNKISLYGTNTTSIYGLGVQGGALQLFADNAASDILFGYGSSTIFNEKMRIKGSGNVGIGTPTPLAILHVSDPATEKLRLENTTGLNLGIRNELYFKTGTYFTGGIKTIGTAPNAARLGFFTYADPSSAILVERLTILDGGNVGIGKSDPTAKLEVNGTMKITDGTQGIGKVLTSDADGLVSWATPLALTLPYTGTLTSTQTLFAISNDGGNSISGYSPGAGNVAVQGTTSSGTGISGSANAGTGVNAYSNTGNAGVFQSQTGLAIKTLGGGVELNGKIKIADGTQGTNKILTCDAAGLASWVTPAVVMPPVAAGFYVQKSNSIQTIFNNNLVKIDFGTGASGQFGTGYNSSTSQFTAPATGYYQFNLTLNFMESFVAGTLNPIYIYLYKGGNAFYSYQFEHTTKMGSRGFSQMVYLLANDVIEVRVLNQSGTSIDVNGNSLLPAFSSFSGYKIN